MSSSVARITPQRGRPRKFSEPSRPVTLTLPQRVIDALEAADHDLSRSIVRLAQPLMTGPPGPPAELSIFGRRAVIVVNPSRALEERTGIVLVPLADGRALMSLDESTTIPEIELTLREALDDGQLTREDARVFKCVAELLRQARVAEDVKAEQRRIIVLESRKRARG